MNNKKDGGPAFPLGSGDERDPVGMSLRDYFAAKATESDLSAFRNYDSIEEKDIQIDRVTARYRFADAMLEAREK